METKPEQMFSGGFDGKTGVVETKAVFAMGLGVVLSLTVISLRELIAIRFAPMGMLKDAERVERYEWDPVVEVCY